MAQPRVILEGSERHPLKDVKILGKVNPDERFTVTVVLKPGSPVQAPRGRVLSREELVAKHGAPSAAWDAVRRFAHENGLAVVDEHPADRTVHLSGDAKSMSAAFGVVLNQADSEGKIFRYREKEIKVPASLADVALAVMGLDNREQA